MSIKRVSALGLFLGFFLLFPLQVFSGIASSTQIVTSGEPVLIDHLVIGSKISGYTPQDSSFPDVSVEDIRVEEVEGVYTITTDRGVIQASGDQLFYEIVSQNFIRAEQLKAGDFLLTKNSKALRCTSVEYENTLTKVYDLTLQEPHLFFSSEAQVLTHNTPILILTIPPLAPVAAVALIFIGVVALDSYVEKFKHSSNRRDRMGSGDKEKHQHYEIPSGGGQMPDPNDPNNKKDEEQGQEVDRVRDAKDKSDKAVNDTLQGLKRGRETKGRTKQFEKPGDIDDAASDFEKLGLTDIQDIPTGKRGKLPDGRFVNVRNRSEDGRPTLEIYNGKSSIKIRYGSK